MKSIVLAEKPSVAKELARVLNCPKRNKHYWEGAKYLVTWALGHLVTLAEPEYYNKKYREWNLEDLPLLPEKMKLKIIRQTSPQFRAITGLFKRKDVNELIIATDAGREGELVARWIMKLGGWHKQCRRVWISSQTDQAIRQGFVEAKSCRDYDTLYQAAVCRAEADWLIGLNVTRALTCKFNAQLTAGRVQTPTLAMIIEREKQIQHFQPKDYWTIKVEFGGYFGHWRGKGGNSNIFDQNKARKIIEKIEGKEAVISHIRKERKTEPAPLAYDLTELQRDCNNRFGFSAKKTLNVLQGLYERHKIVTYPRTDSRYITRDMIPTLPDRLRSVAVGPYLKWAQAILEKKLTPGKRLVNDSKVSDHHAIIPTEQEPNLDDLSTDERKLYDLIVKRFLSLLLPLHRYEKTTITSSIENEHFYSHGRVVIDAGWKIIAGSHVYRESSDDQPPEQILQQQKQGQIKRVEKCHLEKGKTKPPARYTEATLLSAMENPGKFIDDEDLKKSIQQGGLGTPATRADIIEKLLYNSYMERKGKSLFPTSKGMQLIALVPDQLKSAELTAKWEQRLTRIAQGKEKDKKFLEEIRKNAIALVASVIADESIYKADNITKHKCPMCGKYLLLVNAKKGKDLACQDRECGFRRPEKLDNRSGKKSRAEMARDRQLIKKYSGTSRAETNLGDLLKEALAKKNKKIAKEDRQ